MSDGISLTARAACIIAIVEGDPPIGRVKRVRDELTDMVSTAESARDAALARVAEVEAKLAAAEALAKGEETKRVEAEKVLSAAGVALSNVSGALVDSGVIVPADEWRYGEAVREITKKRDEAVLGRTAAQDSCNALEISLIAARAQLAALSRCARALVEALPVCDYITGSQSKGMYTCGKIATRRDYHHHACEDHRTAPNGEVYGEEHYAAPLRALLAALDSGGGEGEKASAWFCPWCKFHFDGTSDMCPRCAEQAERVGDGNKTAHLETK